MDEFLRDPVGIFYDGLPKHCIDAAYRMHPYQKVSQNQKIGST